MQGKLLFLGTGGSLGIPMIGCDCDVCQSPSPFNKRLRSSALIEIKSKRILIDAGPDFRTQALNYRIDSLSGVLLTHAHADHIGGLDDLRAYYFLNKQKIPCLLSQETFEEVKLRYHYMLAPLKSGKSVSAQIDFKLFEEDFGEAEIGGIKFRYLSYLQSGMKVTGFRFGNLAYVSDIRQYSDRVFDVLQGVDTLILSALRNAPSVMHFSIEEAIAFARRTRAKKTYLTHVAHELEHAAANALLPPDVAMSYDGLSIPIEIADEEIR
jgi:phosphoribosyl 1,2-cyclic phosphate phosphodiesterase